jgi:hypothetical protein
MTRTKSCVQDWFGPEFEHLHPLLQHLHLQGGVLAGEVHIQVGRGLAGVLGRRLAYKMGIPIDQPHCPLRVVISHRAQQLHWARTFGTGTGSAKEVLSVFEAVGQHPGGYWVERTGAMHFKMTVDVIDGGWHWRALGASLHGLPLPISWLPRSRAYKRIENGAYRFEVAFVMPLLGPLFSYSGLLQLEGA